MHLPYLNIGAIIRDKGRGTYQRWLISQGALTMYMHVEQVPSSKEGHALWGARASAVFYVSFYTPTALYTSLTSGGRISVFFKSDNKLS